MEETTSQRQNFNKWLADYMLYNGYHETLECFKGEADFPEEVDHEAGSDELSSVEDGSSREQSCPTKPCRRLPWFLVTMSLAQICTHIYMVISQDHRHESPLIKDPFR